MKEGERGDEGRLSGKMSLDQRGWGGEGRGNPCTHTLSIQFNISLLETFANPSLAVRSSRETECGECRVATFVACKSPSC